MVTEADIKLLAIQHCQDKYTLNAEDILLINVMRSVDPNTWHVDVYTKWCPLRIRITLRCGDKIDIDSRVEVL